MASGQVSGELPEPFFRGSESALRALGTLLELLNSKLGMETGTLKLKPKTLELEL